MCKKTGNLLNYKTEMSYHSFTVMVGVKLNTSHQELVLSKTHDTDFVLFSVFCAIYNCLFMAMQCPPSTYLCVCSIMSDIVHSLCVSVPLDPAEVLHYSLCCPGQTLGMGHHLVQTHTHKRIDIQLCRHTEFLMQSSPGGPETQLSLWLENEVDSIYSLRWVM